MKFAALYCAAIVLFGVFSAVQVQVPQNQRDAMDARYRSFGVTLPDGGIVLPNPYAPPYSSRSFVVPASWFADFVRKSESHEAFVSAQALRADLPTLHELLENAYPGYTRAQRLGWNWDNWFRSWDEMLARAGDAPVPAAQAFAPWEQLEDFQIDNHSRPLIPGFQSESVSARLDATPASCTSLRTTDGRVYSISKSDAGQQPHAAYDWDGAKFTPAAYISYPQRYGAAAAVMCDGTAVSVTMTAQPRVAVSAPVYEVIGNGIVYIRTPQSFTYQNDEKFDAMLPAGSDAQRERVVVLDLRSNGGGAAPMSMLRRWYSSDEVARALAPGTIHTSNSCFTTALWFNAGQSMAASLKAPIASPIRALLQAQVDAIAATPPAHCSVQWITKRGAAQPQHRFTMRRQDPRQTRVIAIVDNHCGSDCEALTLALSRLPDTVIAGTSTAGVMGFSRPGMFVLPYSRVPFMLALQLTDPYGDSRSIDGYGIPVDVLLATAQAQSMDSVIALARALSN